MGPSEIQEMIDTNPFIPLRLTLSSGTVIELSERDTVNIVGLSLSVLNVGLSGEPRLRFISIPKIAIAEPVVGRQSDQGGRK